MLRIINTRTATEHRWTLCGQLTGPWVGELRSNWEAERADTGGRRCIIDLSDVTLIDENGEAALRVMGEAGAEFVATGMATRHLLEDLRHGRKRPLRKCLAHLTPESPVSRYR